MTFANEVRDFASAFGAISNILGTRSSREAARLDNEYRRAQIDYTNALTAERGASGIDLDTYLAPGYHGRTWDDYDDGDDGSDEAPIATASSGSAQYGDSARATSGSFDYVPTPPAKPVSTAAVDDDDLSGFTPGASTMVGSEGDDEFDVDIGDRTSMRGMRSSAMEMFRVANATARQMGVRLVITAGAGPGHLSHGSGTELDVMGYREDGSQWTAADRARVAAAGASAGANRFGLYPGGSLHIGIAGEGRPSAVWGAGGRVRGDSSRQFSNRADMSFLKAFNSGQLFGGSGFMFQTGAEEGGYDALDNAREAIARIESMGSGGYGARNKQSGALGRYQVMPVNLPEWSRRAVGRVVSPQEFLANPDIQDKVFDYQFGNLFMKYGNLQDAASAWFTGRPLSRGGGASDGNITGSQYVARFNDALGLPGGSEYSAGSGTAGRLAGGTGKDDALAPYPFSQQQDLSQQASAPTDIASRSVALPESIPLTDTATPPVEPEFHTVEPGDTLWGLTKKYGLDHYQQIMDANPELEDPDKLTIGQVLRIPGRGAEGDAEAEVPIPPERGVGAGVSDDLGLEPGSYTPFEQEDAPYGLYPRPRPNPETPESYTPFVEQKPALEAEPPFVGEERPLPDYSNFQLPPPSPETVWDERAEARIREQRLADEASRQGEAVSRPRSARFQEVMDIVHGGAPGRGPNIRGALADDLISEGGGVPPAPERGPIDRYKLGGATSDEDLAGGQGADTLGPAEASIVAVTDLWRISPDGHVMTPDGRKSVNDTFTSGRNAAREGANWLSEMIFGDGEDETDAAEDAAPDDGQPNAATAYLSGKFALSRSSMQKIHASIDKWAEENGITMTDSERNMRSLGVMFDFWMTQGQPEKARAVAGAMLQYHRVLYGQYSAIAKAALKAGDDDKALEAMVRAYSEVPDGRDITVTGDVENGFTFSYINEETGKTISKKVISPQELTGMIMGMGPDDVDKFLVKAAGEDELPEPSAALTSALDRLNATPEGAKPVFDARAMAYFDSGEASIYSTAFSQKMNEWNEYTGGAEGRAYQKDLASMGGGSGSGGGAVPAGPATPAAPASATPAASPADTPAASSTPVPAPASTPVAATPVTSGSAPSYPAGVFPPGNDGTYGLGPAPRLDIPKYARLLTSGGRDVAEAMIEQDTQLYNEELTKRATAWGNYAAQGGDLYPTEGGALDIEEARTKDEAYTPVGPTQFGSPRESPIVSSSLLDVPGTMPWRGRLRPGGPRGEMVDVGTERLLRQAPGLIPELPLGPENYYGLGARPSEDPNRMAAAARDPTGAASAYYKASIARQQDAYDTLAKVAADNYTEMTALPKPAEYTQGDRDAVSSTIQSVVDEPPADTPQEETDHIRANQGNIEYIAQTLGQLNHLSPGGAVETALSMTTANEDEPSLPNFVALQHPLHPTMWLMQPLSLDGTPDGPELLVPENVLQTIVQTWQQHADVVIQANRQRGADAPWKGFGGEANAPPRGPGQGMLEAGQLDVTEHYDMTTAPTAGAVPVAPITGGTGVPFIPGRGATPSGVNPIDTEEIFDPTYELPGTDLPYNPRGGRVRIPAIPLD